MTIEPDARATASWVYVTDGTREGAAIAETLRASGYNVAEVQLPMLVARIATQRPRAVVIDADAGEAFESVARMRELPDTEEIDVIFVGQKGGLLTNQTDAFTHDGSGFLPRPVDTALLVKKIEALIGFAQSSRPGIVPPERPSRPFGFHESLVELPVHRMTGLSRGLIVGKPSAVLPAVAPGDAPLSPPPPPAPSQSSLPPASMRGGAEVSSTRPPMSRPTFGAFPSDARDLAMGALVGAKGAFPGSPLSPELSLLLAEAEGRVPLHRPPESIPSPEEEIEAVLPAAFLEALDEPLGGDEEPDASFDADGTEGRQTLGPSKGATTGVETSGGRSTHSSDVGGLTPAPPKTHGGTPSATTGGSTQGGTTGARVRTTGASRSASGLTPETPLGAMRSENRAVERAAPRQGLSDDVKYRVPAPPAAQRIDADEGARVHPTETTARPKLPNPFPAQTIAAGEAAPVLAYAVSRRLSGALAFESPHGMRRVVLREGDMITAASTNESENLLAFLVQHGDLPRELSVRIAAKIPPFGRHAGAALVAHGYLRQDQMWPVLRAHAESIIARTLTEASGVVVLEEEPPGRLKGEPAVFGGSTGAEVFIDLVRRETPDEVALAKLRGASRVGKGAHDTLISECGLPEELRRVLEGGAGKTVAELTSPPYDAPPALLLALSWLSVIALSTSLPSTRPLRMPDEEAPSEAAVRALDAEAIRATVKARMQVVDEGDYFAVLGVARSATGYEIRRAFLDLRRTFEPSRLLTPETFALSEDVRTIASVLEEAYEILRDPARRERYRRAIDGDGAG